MEGKPTMFRERLEVHGDWNVSVREETMGGQTFNAVTPEANMCGMVAAAGVFSAT